MVRLLLTVSPSLSRVEVFTTSASTPITSSMVLLIILTPISFSKAPISLLDISETAARISFPQSITLMAFTESSKASSTEVFFSTWSLMVPTIPSLVRTMYPPTASPPKVSTTPKRIQRITNKAFPTHPPANPVNFIFSSCNLLKGFAAKLR